MRFHSLSGTSSAHPSSPALAILRKFLQLLIEDKIEIIEAFLEFVCGQQLFKFSEGETVLCILN